MSDKMQLRPEALANLKRLEHLGINFYFLSREIKLAICSLPNLKTLNYIHEFEHREYEALLDSCGHSLKKLTIYDNCFSIPPALARENLALRYLLMKCGDLSAGEVIEFC